MLKTKIFIAAAALICWGCARNHEHSEHSEFSEHSEHEHDEHSDLIELPDEQAEHFGVEVDTVYPAPFATVLRASGVIERSAANTAEAVAPVAGTISYRGVNQGLTVGRGAVLAVVNPSAVSGGDANRAAKAAVDAARREVERLEPLYRDRLVTAVTYNAAKAELERAEAEYSPAASSATVSSPIAGVVTSLLVADGSYVQAGQPVVTVSSDTRLTLHAEVPADRYAELAGITDARIGDFTLSEHAGKKSGVSAENGYGCVYFTFNGDDLIAPGSGGEVYLLGAPRPGVLSVPLGAIVEQQGEYFLFTRCSPGHYKKHAVTLGASDGRRVEITSGLEPGEAVVTAGAITVRLAESSGAIPEGHSHNH
ncbi:MAG: efflux RND transporter periplasmic adaptor subunit [Muribaculaceae bacterium]|nr:efflux RND transporter periplasmic adaptor subunit [Muribaculaceae bacterium]